MLDLIPRNKMIDENGLMHNSWDKWFISLRHKVNFGEKPSVILDITNNSGIKIGNLLTRVQNKDNGDVIITRNPQIYSGDNLVDGKKVTIEGMNDNKTVTLKDGNGLKLESDITLKNGDCITLHYNKISNLWIENSRSVK